MSDLMSLTRLQSTEECRVEGYANVAERNCGEIGSEFDWLRFSFCLFCTFLDNRDEPLLDVLKGHLRHEDLNVKIRQLEEVEHTGEEVERA